MKLAIAEGVMAVPEQTAALAEGKLAGDWTLDPARSRIGLKTKSMWGMAKVNGAFGKVSGQGTVSPAGEVTGTITVGAGSLDTGNRKRDDHLRSADFFDSANYPEITFTADSLVPAGDGVTVTGKLTVRNRTRPVSFGASLAVTGDDVALDGEVRINRADFGLTWNQLGMASMDNAITITAVFARR